MTIIEGKIQVSDMQLYEKYRPKTLYEFIGQDKVKEQIKLLMSRPDWDQDAIWIEGSSGIGKTSLGWITLLESLPKYRLVIFTTTESLENNLFGGFSGPFARRCKVFKLIDDEQLTLNFAKRAKEIARAESLDSRPLQDYIRLVQDCNNNMGAVLQRIEMGEMLL